MRVGCFGTLLRIKGRRISDKYIGLSEKASKIVHATIFSWRPDWPSSRTSFGEEPGRARTLAQEVRKFSYSSELT